MTDKNTISRRISSIHLFSSALDLGVVSSELITQEPHKASTLPNQALTGPSSAQRRLLKVLSEPGTFASPEDETTMIVRGQNRGVSLGRGRYPAALVKSCCDADWLRTEKSATGLRYTITAAGKAALRRAASSSKEAGFTAQHRVLVTEKTRDGEPVTINIQESPLEWLRRRKGRGGHVLIDHASWQAGERLRSDITFAGMLPSVSSKWGLVGRGDFMPCDPTDAMLAARQRVTKALDAVGGDMADILIDICGFLKGLEWIERERGWPARSAKVVVTLALSKLAQHYGYQSEARGSRRREAELWQARM